MATRFGAPEELRELEAGNLKTAIGDFGHFCLISCPQPAVVDAGRHNLLYAADVLARNPLAADA